MLTFTLPTELYVEIRINSNYVPPRMGKPKGHNVHLYVTRVPGAYLYRRVDGEHTDTWTVPDIKQL